MHSRKIKAHDVLLQRDEWDCTQPPILSLTVASWVEHCSLFNMGTNINECVHYHM